MLTKVQKKRLAREARGLAMECIDNGPKMQNVWCGCAIGISLKRAGLLPRGYAAQVARGREVEKVLDQDSGFWSCGLLSEATCERVLRANPTAVVFPLLALADALEESSEQPPAGPSKDF